MYYSEYTTESTEDSTKKFNYSDCTGAKPKFRFPPPPRLSKSATDSFSTASDSSNSGVYTKFNLSKKKRCKSGYGKKLPPLGIYWDIENCSVPKNKSASGIVQKLREVFLKDYRESEFVVVCDVKKESPQIIQDLHDSQVSLIHVASLSKNAADEKLRQSLRRFAELHPAPSGIVLISSDVNYASDMSDLRYRKKIRVILVHNANVADSLILCANEHHSFKELMKDVPDSRNKVNSNFPSFMKITNLPPNFHPGRIKNRLRMLIENCGGKITYISSPEGFAVVKFGNVDTALRAQRRIQGEDVFGNKIKVLSPSVRHYSGRKIKHGDSLYPSNRGYGIQPPPGFENVYGQNYQNYNQSNSTQNYQDANSKYGAYGGMRPIRGSGASSVNPLESNLNQSWIKNPNKMHPEQINASTNTLPSRVHRISGSSEFSDDGKMCYTSENDNNIVQANRPVDLIISNLDPMIDCKELKRLLTNMLKTYAMILSLNVAIQTDGMPVAYIRVNSQQEAQFAISQLHRQKVGQKRIVVSHAQTDTPNLEQLRAMVIGLLQEVPNKCMPLFKFIELLETRYHCTVSVSEVNKLRNICKISDYGPRIISLTQEVKSSPPPNLSKICVHYCIIHCPNGLQNRGWSELGFAQTPNIIMPLKSFADKLLNLLNVHMGCMPLLSFQACYEQEFQEPLPVQDAGVPLEHLILCVPNTEIKFVGPNKNIKVISYDQTKQQENEEDIVLKSVPPSLASNIILLCRELVEILKKTEKCQLLFSKFIPAYHHHFGRQCRVADYGYTKLLDLFESIPHVIQIMGDGSSRTITLSHAAQMRRFTSDLLRVLKVQPAKQISYADFASAFEKVMNRPFNAVEYGLCMFEDLLQEVPENTVVISKVDDDQLFIAIPKRQQTAEEKIRTKQFAVEVIDLLRHSPYHRMLFDKFVPAYHRHFGHQCRVSDYGFTKLIELFEAIPDIVKIDEHSEGERTVSLTLQESLKILGSQIVQIIKFSKKTSLSLDELPKIYLYECGHPLEPKVYECETVKDVVRKLSNYVQLVNGNAGSLLVAVDVDTIPSTLTVRCWALLIDPPHGKEMAAFRYEYQRRYNSNFSDDSLQKIGNVIWISSSNDTNFISLTVLYVLAAELYHVIYNSGGSALFSSLEKLYYETYCKSLRLSDYHINSVDEFYNTFSLFFLIKRSKKKSVVVLNHALAEHSVPIPFDIYKYNSPNYNNSEEVAPPLPPFEMIQNTTKKVSPPKPDTPPTPGASLWSHWSPLSGLGSAMNLSIPLPISFDTKLLDSPSNLISPARILWPLSKNTTWSNSISCVTAPDPIELPMPDKLISKGELTTDDDSGVNIKLENSSSDNENNISANNYLFGCTKPSFATCLNFNK